MKAFLNQLQSAASCGPLRQLTISHDERCFSVPEIARVLGVRPAKIRHWLGTGELVGINIEQRGKGRPNWRIPPSSVAAFLANRSSAPATAIQEMSSRA